MYSFNFCPDQQINPPASYFENDQIDYDSYRCEHCGDVHSNNIFGDVMTNGNICINCLENEDFCHFHDMSESEYKVYAAKVRKLNPVNPI